MDAEDLLLADYQVKVRYLTDHLQRMWTRFNFFVTLQSGLVAGLIFTRDGGTFTQAAFYFLVAEAVLSLVWWIFGAQDRRLVGIYREQLEQTWALLAGSSPGASQIAGRLGVETMAPAYPYAGQTSDRPDLEWHGPFEWRWEPVSTTHLPAVVPFALLLFWLAMTGVFLATP